VLQAGSNEVSFPVTIVKETTYRVEIQADYDLLDANLAHSDVILAEQVIYTHNDLKPEGYISNVSVTEESITLDIDVEDVNNTINGLIYARLYLDDALVTETALVLGNNVGVTFTGLLSGDEYELKVETDYDNGDGNGTYASAVIGSQAISTDTKTMASASVAVQNVEDDQITWQISVTDDDNVTNVINAKLYDGSGNLVDTKALVVGLNTVTFTSLTMATSYELRIEVTYDMNDGVGTQDATLATDIQTTDSNVTPSATITDVSAGDTTIDVSVSVTDDDSVITSNLKAVLKQNGTLVDEIALSVGDNSIQFTGLYTGTDYEIVIVTDYNLNDGNGVVSARELDSSTATTITQIAPSATIDATSAITGSITVDATIVDDDNVITSANLNLYDSQGTLLDQIAISAGTVQETFTGLTPNSDYTVKVVVDYDFNDGSSIVSGSVLASQDQATNSIISISNITNDIDANDKGRHQIDVEVLDVDSILTSSLLTATLYENGVPLATYIVSKDTITTIQMINLLNDYDYSLEISASFDSGAGTVTEVVETYEFTTLPLAKPSVSIALFETWTLTPNVSLNLTVGTDDNNVASDTGWTAYLYADGVLVDTVDIDATYANPEGTTTTITFTGYAATGNEAFTILITGMVDMHNVPGGSAVETALASATGIDAGN